MTYLGQDISTGDALGVSLMEFWNRDVKNIWSLDGSAPGPGPTLTPDLAGRDGELTNGAGIYPSSAHAAVLYRGASGPLFRTADLGRRWTLVRRTGRFEQLFWLNFATSRVGAGLFVTRAHPEQAAFWRTTDGGATWHSVPIR